VEQPSIHRGKDRREPRESGSYQYDYDVDIDDLPVLGAIDPDDELRWQASTRR